MVVKRVWFLEVIVRNILRGNADISRGLSVATYPLIWGGNHDAVQRIMTCVRQSVPVCCWFDLQECSMEVLWSHQLCPQILSHFLSTVQRCWMPARVNSISKSSLHGDRNKALYCMAVRNSAESLLEIPRIPAKNSHCSTPTAWHQVKSRAVKINPRRSISGKQWNYALQAHVHIARDLRTG